VGLTPTEAPSKDYLGKALAVAKKSTASIGKFTENLPKEKPSKFSGKKRKVGICLDAIKKTFKSVQIFCCIIIYYSVTPQVKEQVTMMI
jgi:hypothetical protein